ncbi:MAG: DNA repair protein RecO [Deltaproteobacteria bacterium]|nr:DNA repair protein RecO [Deltaproteobacteria bacterium]
MTAPGAATLALVLDRVPFGERDLVMTLLTRESGLVSAIARSARGSRRFGGALDLLVVLSVDVRARSSGLGSLRSAEAVRAFPGLFDSLERLEAGQAAIQLARDLLRDAPASPLTFDHAVDALAAVEAAPAGAAHGPVLRFCLAVLSDIGHAPALAACPRCRTPFAGTGALVVDDGALLCPGCAGPGALARLDASVLAYCAGEAVAVPPERGAALEALSALVSATLGRTWRPAFSA